MPGPEPAREPTFGARRRNAAVTSVVGCVLLMLALAVLPPRLTLHLGALACWVVVAFAYLARCGTGAALAAAITTTAGFIGIWLSYAPVHVEGASMEPAFSSGQLVFAHRWRMDIGLRTGDVVVFVSPEAPYHLVMKRVVAVAGDDVRHDRDGLQVNARSILRHHQPMTPSRRDSLDTCQVYVLGDNSEASRDSRSFGPLSTDRVLGVVLE